MVPVARQILELNTRNKNWDNESEHKKKAHTWFEIKPWHSFWSISLLSFLPYSPPSIPNIRKTWAPQTDQRFLSLELASEESLSVSYSSLLACHTTFMNEVHVSLPWVNLLLWRHLESYYLPTLMDGLMSYFKGSSIALGCNVRRIFEQIGVWEEFVKLSKPTFAMNISNQQRERICQFDFRGQEE